MYLTYYHDQNGSHQLVEKLLVLLLLGSLVGSGEGGHGCGLEGRSVIRSESGGDRTATAAAVREGRSYFVLPPQDRQNFPSLVRMTTTRPRQSVYTVKTGVGCSLAHISIEKGGGAIRKCGGFGSDVRRCPARRRRRTGRTGSEGAVGGSVCGAGALTWVPYLCLSLEKPVFSSLTAEGFFLLQRSRFEFLSSSAETVG